MGGAADRIGWSSALRSALIMVAALAVGLFGVPTAGAAPPGSLGSLDPWSDIAPEKIPESLDPAGPLSPLGGLSPGMLRFDPGTGPNPIVLPIAADPSVLRADDGTFYLYATSDDWHEYGGWKTLPIFTSDNLVDWTYAGDALRSRPGWIPGDAGIWAPDVHRAGGQYVMYYSVGYLDPARDPCIGRATAPSPAGPFTDRGKVLCASDVGVGGTIDPHVDYSTGVPVMFVGNYQGVYAIELTADGAGPVPDTEPVLVAGKGYEAPFVQYRGGFYYLYLSAGNCCNGAASDYRIYVGRSESLTGPYLDRDGHDLTDPNIGERLLTGSLSWIGPGHNTVVTDDEGTDWIIYHAAPADRPQLTPNGPQNRQGMIDRLDWVGGWPQVPGGVPSGSAPAMPVIHGVAPPEPNPDPPPSAGSLQSLAAG